MTSKESAPKDLCPKPPSLFVRDATGLVREWSHLDGFIYNVMALAFPVGFSLAFSLIPFTFPGADINLTVVFTVIFVLPIAITYAMMASAMPRSGGDYVYQSRILHPAIGFMNGVAYMIIIDALFSAIDGVLVSNTVISPLFATIARGNQLLQSAATWFGGSSGAFVTGTLILILALVVNVAGMKTFAKIQRISFIIGLIGALLTIGILLSFTHSQFVSAYDTFASSYGGGNNNYQTILGAASKAGFSTNLGTSLASSALGVTITGFSFLFIMWSSENAGEIKKASNFRLQVFQMVGALLFGALLLFLLNVAVDHSVGSDFLRAIGYVYFTGSTSYTLPTAPYFSLFAFILYPNPIAFLVIFAFMFLWTFWAVANGPLAGARFGLAASFDRALPEKLSSVSERFHVPTLALTFYIVLAIIFAALYEFVPSVGSFTLDLIFGGAVLQLFTCIAAAIYPLRSATKESYQISEISRMTIKGFPIISLVALIATAILLWLLFQYATVSALGVNSPPSAEFLVVVYAISLGGYFVASSYRKRSGIDLTLAFKQLPPE